MSVWSAAVAGVTAVQENQIGEISGDALEVMDTFLAVCGLKGGWANDSQAMQAEGFVFGPEFQTVQANLLNGDRKNDVEDFMIQWTKPSSGESASSMTFKCKVETLASAEESSEGLKAVAQWLLLIPDHCATEEQRQGPQITEQGDDEAAATPQSSKLGVWTELKNRLPGLEKGNPEHKEQRMALFSQFDPNGNGYLSLAEVDAHCRSILGLDTLTDDLAPILMRAFTAAKDVRKATGKNKKHGDDYVERAEFRLLMVYIYQFFELWFMFDEIDSGDDRRVNMEEFKAALPKLETWGVPAGDAEAQFKAIDTNDGGIILFQEFADWALKNKLDADGDAEGDSDLEQPPQEDEAVKQEEDQAVPQEEEEQAEKEAEEEEVEMTPWEVAVKAVSSITTEDMMEITAFAQPPPGAQEVLDAFFSVCGVFGGYTAETKATLQVEALHFGAFARISKNIIKGQHKDLVNTYVNETLPVLRTVINLEEADSVSRVVGLVAGVLLLIPEWCADQITLREPVVATAEEEVDETVATAASTEPEKKEEDASTANEEEANATAEEEDAEEGSGQVSDPDQQVTSDDVAWEYGDHYFTKADVVDVTKIQASYRRKHARRKVEDAKAHRQQMKDEEAERRRQRVNRIELPDDSELVAPVTAAAVAAAEEKEAKAAASGTKARGGFIVDYSKPLNRQDMSADTKGMQRMYSRMLKTKMWW